MADYLNNYRLEERLGAGGMGVVWRAVDTSLERDVAIKLLHDSFGENSNHLSRFKREARILAGLDHPAIAAVHGFEIDSESKRPFLVMELLEGVDLGRRLKSGAMSIDAVRQVGSEIAEALSSAHEANIVHRDLKPGNIMISETGRAKILDFGIAKDMSGASSSAVDKDTTARLTREGIVIGTPAYLAPEQVRGTPIDIRVDVWAFGCVLFEMLTGRCLFDGDSVSDTVAAVLSRTVDWDELPASTPGEMRWLMRRCLERDVDRRLKDLGEARLALADPDAYFAGVSGTPGRATKPRLRQYELVIDDLEAGWLKEPVISPDGRRVAYLIDGRLAVRELDRLESQVFHGTEGAMIPFWSPEGDHLAFVANGKLWRVSIADGRKTRVADVPDGLVGGSGGTWMRGDKILFSCGTTSGIRRVSARGGVAVDCLTPDIAEDQHDFHEPKLMPDGRSLLTTIHREKGGHDVLAVYANDRLKALSDPDEVLKSYAVYSRSGHILYESVGRLAGIWAVPFDVDALQITGDPFLVVPDGQYPSLSDNDTLLYAPRRFAGRRQFLWLDRSGEVVGRIGEASSMGWMPSVSPKGTQVTVSSRGSDRDIWLYDVDSGCRSGLGIHGDLLGAASWSASGNDIIYDALRGGERFVCRRPADGTGREEKLASGWEGSLSPDERHVVYVAGDGTTGGRLQIFCREIGAGEPRLLAPDDGRQDSPQFSPDGRHVLFQSNESGLDQVYLTTFPEGDRRWRVSRDGGALPRWGADGTEIFFETGTTLMAVDVNTASGMQLGSPYALFSVNAINGDLALGFGVSPDSERFVVTQFSEEDAGVRRLTVVENWFEEFAGGL